MSTILKQHRRYTLVQPIHAIRISEGGARRGVIAELPVETVVDIVGDRWDAGMIRVACKGGDYAVFQDTLLRAVEDTAATSEARF